MKTKPRKTFRVSALLLIVCLISTVMLSGTFAKYTSEYAGQDTALVARWSFTAKGGDGDIALGTSAAPKELKLFDHVYDTHINKNYGKDTEDYDQFIIAPGVGDEFTLKMDYIADVDADVLISITGLDGNAAVPMEYSVDNGANWVTLANLPDALAEQIKTTNVGGAISASAPDADGSFRIAKVGTDIVEDINISGTVMWRWPYEAKADVVAGSTNETDTALGVASQAAVAAPDPDDITLRTTYGIKIDLKATQVTPTTE